MGDKDEVLSAILTLHEATEMRFNAIDARLAGQDKRFDSIDAKFAALDTRSAAQDTRFDRLERFVREGFDDVRDGLASVNQRLDRLERRRGPR